MKLLGKATLIDCTVAPIPTSKALDFLELWLYEIMTTHYTRYFIFHYLYLFYLFKKLEQPQLLIRIREDWAPHIWEQEIWLNII